MVRNAIIKLLEIVTVAATLEFTGHGILAHLAFLMQSPTPNQPFASYTSLSQHTYTYVSASCSPSCICFAQQVAKWQIRTWTPLCVQRLLPCQASLNSNWADRCPAPCMVVDKWMRRGQRRADQRRADNWCPKSVSQKLPLHSDGDALRKCCKGSTTSVPGTLALTRTPASKQVEAASADASARAARLG